MARGVNINIHLRGEMFWTKNPQKIFCITIVQIRDPIKNSSKHKHNTNNSEGKNLLL